MEQKLQMSSCLVCDRLLPLVATYPWLQLAQSEEVGDQIPYNTNESLSYYPSRNPALVGRRIRGYFHGWLILSSHPDNVMWFLWNPVTLKTIYLPPLALKDGDSESIRHCCLPSAPYDIGSVLLLTRAHQQTFVFCRLDRKRKRMRWTEMTYAKQLKSITSTENGFLNSLTCCNVKVYALSSGHSYYGVIQVHIVVKDEEVVISLMPFVDVPSGMPYNGNFIIEPILKGRTQLIYVEIVVLTEAMRTFTEVHLFKLDMTSMTWEEPEDLNNTIYFVDLAHRCWLYYRPTISSESGGYIHIFGKLMDKVVSSYNLEDKTVSLSSTLRLVPKNLVTLWECRAIEDDKEDEIMAKDVKLVDTNNKDKSPLLSVSFGALKMIMELFVGVEYLNFRATCKDCLLAAPVIRWRNEASLVRLKTYSLPSPWLMVFDTHQGVITFTDPMFGDKYFMKTPPEMIGDVRIHWSGYGWLLVFNLSHEPVSVMLFNPFTNDIRMLPHMGYIRSVCFAEPPTSPDCKFVGFITSNTLAACVHYVNREPAIWVVLHAILDENAPRSISFPTLCEGSDVYALEAEGRLDVYRNVDEAGWFWEVAAEAPRGCSLEAQCFLVKCDENRLLLVRVDEYGESVEVYKLNQSTREWEKIDGLGRHMIYICGATCICVEAKTREMENKIYFPRLHSKNGKIVFYSLKTRRYHTFDGRKVEEESLEDFLGTKYILNPHAWIEPSWC